MSGSLHHRSFWLSIILFDFTLSLPIHVLIFCSLLAETNTKEEYTYRFGITDQALKGLRYSAISMLALFCFYVTQQKRYKFRFVPWLQLNQTCEHCFRGARHAVHGDINFDLLQFMSRVSLWQTLELDKAERVATGVWKEGTGQRRAFKSCRTCGMHVADTLSQEYNEADSDFSSITRDDIARTLREAEAIAARMCELVGVTFRAGEVAGLSAVWFNFVLQFIILVLLFIFIIHSCLFC